ncbi:MAG: peptide chain release factor N(5)-glutamine methyltransferase [Lachnospiraceae bacterium]|nr:peptide chain release factor N(5)-glutamine methyltransferase [Lachnospiraceae bacterium]
MTYSEALSFGDRELKEAGISEHRIDSGLLLLFVTGRDRTFLLTDGRETELRSGEEQSYREAIEKRKRHVPLQLITGSADFMGLKFLVAENVLIPRIDTEFLVEEALKTVQDGSEVLDMCTGSGCILLSLMKYKNDIRGTGADISDAALELAKKNAEALGLNDVCFIKSDLFENISSVFDHILCNPPYIKSKEIGGLMEEVRLFDPVNSLDGGEDGLIFYRRLAEEAKPHLIGGGSLILEIGHTQGEAVSAILKEAGFKYIEVLKDYSGNERVVKCLKS